MVNPGADICTAPHGAGKYAGFVMNKESIATVCDLGGDAQDVYTASNVIGTSAGVAALLNIFDGGNQRHVVVGFGWAAGASYSGDWETPQVQCQWFEGQPTLDPDFWFASALSRPLPPASSTVSGPCGLPS